MKNKLPLLGALLALGGCVSEAQINADLARHIGQPEPDLIRQMGVPSRHYAASGHTFLAYVKGYQRIDGFDGGPGFYPYYGWGWGWGGWGGPFGGYPTDVTPVSCETDFEIVDGRVAGYSRHGNGC